MSSSGKMGLKGSFEGMGTLWAFSMVSSFIFCPLPYWRHIGLLKGGLELCFWSGPLLFLGGGGSSHQKSVAACLSPPPHKVCPLDSLYIVLIHLLQGFWIFAFGPAEHSFWVYLGKPELDFPLIQVCFWVLFLALLAGASVACLSPPPHKGFWICHPPHPTINAG